MTTPIDSTLADALRQQVRGRVATDQVSRALYATDASIYQIPPVAVVTPLDEQDVAATLQVARQHHAAILPRGGATSLAGQTVGAAIHLDFTHSMRHLLELNTAEQWAWVEPGMVLDELNTLLAPHRLHFAPDVSPGNRATIGGMIGNNSCGMYSIRYGKTIDHVLELRVLLSDGTITTFGPLETAQVLEKRTLDSLEGRIYRTVVRLGREHADEIERRFPKVLRRVGGYNLDMFTPGKPFNLSNLIVGSEGTLAVILAAKVRLTPRPAELGMAVLAFPTLDDALDAVVPCLRARPDAVELMDDILLDLTRRSLEYSRYLAQFVEGEPGALLQVEFFGDTPDAVVARLDALERELHAAQSRCTITRIGSAAQRQAVLRVRKAGLPLLQSLSADLKPETFVEDSAVPPERLAEYIRTFRAICHDHGVRVAFYGHASVGLMHARPLINLKDAGDVANMRSIAEKIRDLVLEYGGALSGEHGDGMLRGEFNRAMFGDTLYEAFREIKRTFDPRGTLNPGKITDAPPMDSNLRYGGGYGTIPLETHFQYRDTGGIAGAVELCNGNGLCRKTLGGTMCPSYMVTRDEEHSTRGRANALRMAFSGGIPREELTSERMKGVMDLCIECKGCTSECPSRVNMTRLKSEWLSMYYRDHGVPLRAWVFGHIRQINQLGTLVAPLANAAFRLPGVGVLTEKVLGVSRHRRLPAFVAEPFHRWFRRHTPRSSERTVVLFADTFADYNEPQLARDAVRVLEAAGYRVILPERRVCCGRPLLSKGLLGEAKALLRQQVDALAPYAEQGLPIIGLEPSCILTFRDELPDLVDDARTAAIASHALLIDEFLARELSDGHLHLPLRNAAGREFLLHGHCHQKALVGTSSALALLRQIPGATVREVDSGCCGMAGSFGYEAEHYDISRKMAERKLMPAVRDLAPTGQVVAMGTSCRHQIADFGQREAKHLISVLADYLDEQAITDS